MRISLCLFVGVVSAARIKHVVVLMEENRSFDHFFGWSKLPACHDSADDFSIETVMVWILIFVHPIFSCVLLCHSVTGRRPLGKGV